MKKILLLTDFSEASRVSVFYTVQLYRAIACHFKILHNYVLLPDSTGIMDEEIARMSANTMEGFVAELNKGAVHDEHTFEGLALAGNLYITVNEIYKKEPFDLLVVGANGSGNSVRIGSVATQMIRIAPCPVLVVPGTTRLKRIENIVVATDYTNYQSVEVFKPVKELMTGENMKLIFLSIFDKNEGKWEVDISRQLLLDQYFDSYNPIHYSIEEESTVEGIEEYLEDHKTDLLVTISHHRSLWDIILNRSTSRILAYEAEVPLLVLNERISEGSEDQSEIDWNVIL